jgi:CRISPR/Cas system CMR-associated protein Cmr1 (group 7 of RAMP superfamily)
MSNPHIIRFTLKQHTPLIHFQSQQAYAGLRATEVKPKFDRFILERLGAANILPTWIQGGKKKTNGAVPLRYKMIISNQYVKAKTIERDRKSAPPMFFGNMGDEYENQLKFLSWSFQDSQMTLTGVNCTILLLNNDEMNGKTLKQIIEENLEIFFFLNNFGTRQSKGYGSFSCYSINENVVSNNYPSQYHFTVPDSNPIEALNKINLFYRSIRSGIHDGRADRDTREFTTTFYFKSLLFIYLNTFKNLKWEKRAIKEKLLNWHQSFQQQKDSWNSANQSFDANKNNSNAVLARDMLGLSSEQQWKSYGKKISKEHIPMNEQIKIDRFKSPITFKPIKTNNGYDIHIILQQIPNAMYSTSFNISNGRDHFQINTPNSFQFSLPDFLRWIFNPINIDITKHVTTGANNNTHQTLIGIYSQLAKQIKP